MATKLMYPGNHPCVLGGLRLLGERDDGGRSFKASIPLSKAPEVRAASKAANSAGAAPLQLAIEDRIYDCMIEYVNTVRLIGDGGGTAWVEGKISGITEAP